MYKWNSAGVILMYRPAEDLTSYIVAIIAAEAKSVDLWRGVESQNTIKLPYPEGMKFGPELREYIVMQHKLMK